MIWTVFLAASVTAICTGLGAVPFLFVKEIDKRWLGLGNALAAGLMLGASIGLVIEAIDYSVPRMLLGLALGLAVIILARRWLDEPHHIHADQFSAGDLRKMLLTVGIMTAHSFAEGIAVGVSYGDGNAFGSLITLAIAIHNIPEGLAISLVLVPRGVAVWRAAGWSIFSSVPQPLMAVLAFLFVLFFRPVLPVGLGLAAGAMIWMVFRELLPESQHHLSRPVIGTVTATAALAMIGFQIIISVYP